MRGAMASTAVIFMISYIALSFYLKSSIVATICVKIGNGKLMFIGNESDAAEFHQRIASFESIPSIDKINLDCKIQPMSREMYFNLRKTTE